MIVIVLILAAVALVALGTAFAVVVAGIHLAERHKSLGNLPTTRAEATARRVLGVRSARPSRHTLSAPSQGGSHD